MCNRIVLCILASICLLSCSSNNGGNGKTSIGNPTDKQLNITVILDLSDRIKATDSPSHTERDMAVVKELITTLKADIDKQQFPAYTAREKFRIIVTPTPSSVNIAELLEGLDYDFEKADKSTRIDYYNNMESAICSSLQEIYQQTIEASQWSGSDIWRFFKDDAKIYLENDSLYRNIFVVVTDGYIYHKNSVAQTGNRYSYLTASTLKPYRKTNYEGLIEKNDFGLIAGTNFDDDMEVLFLELRPTPEYQTDFDIMKIVLSKWCNEMGIKKVDCYKTTADLATTRKAIQKFIK